MLDREVIGGRVAKGILWESHPISPHICSVQVQDARIETFDAANFSFHVGYCGHSRRRGQGSGVRGQGPEKAVTPDPCSSFR